MAAPHSSCSCCSCLCLSSGARTEVDVYGVIGGVAESSKIFFASAISGCASDKSASNEKGSASLGQVNRVSCTLEHRHAH